MQALADVGQEPITRYVLQRGVFQTFGSLAQQWPAVTRDLPAAAIGVSALLALLMIGVLTAGRSTVRPVAGAAAWILISVAPVFTWVVIGPNLDQSRYLYLAAPAWSILLAAVASGSTVRRWRTLAAALLVGVIALNLWATRRQLGAWTRAADARDRVIAATLTNADVRRCGEIRLDSLPDNVDGAYVFRNGAPQAMAAAGNVVVHDEADAACRFRWDGLRLVR